MSSSCIPAVRKLDYLRFTLHDLTSPYETMRELGLEFKERGFGLYRYRQSAVSACGTVMVLWDGPVEGMGVHVQVSGEGCRIVEGMENFPGWREWVKGWLDKKAGFSRFDVAVDDVSGHIAFETVVGQVKSRTAVMRATSHKVIEETNRKGTFQTLYVGKRASQTMMRCYDKGMQLGEGRSWLRFEFEYKDDRAHAIACLFANQGWDPVVGTARLFIEFKDETHVTSDRTRQRPAAWWVQLIDASKHKLEVAKQAHASLVKTWAWLKRQVAPAIAVLMEHQMGDIAWVCELADEGKPRWHERHRQMLRGDGELPPLSAVAI
jgi:phage replication initiation protein